MSSRTLPPPLFRVVCMMVCGRPGKCRGVPHQAGDLMLTWQVRVQGMGRQRAAGRMVHSGGWGGRVHAEPDIGKQEGRAVVSVGGYRCTVIDGVAQVIADRDISSYDIFANPAYAATVVALQDAREMVRSHGSPLPFSKTLPRTACAKISTPPLNYHTSFTRTPHANSPHTHPHTHTPTLAPTLLRMHTRTQPRLSWRADPFKTPVAG